MKMAIFQGHKRRSYHFDGERGRDDFSGVNEHMPRTYGENQIHISDVTAIVEHHQPLPELPSTPGQSEKDMKIGDHVASLIKNW